MVEEQGAKPHPEWRRLYQSIGPLIAEGKKVFSYEELNTLAGIDVRTSKGRAQFLRFRKETLNKLSLWFENEREKGYRLVAANEHVNSAALRVARARKMTGRALKIAINTRVDQLSDAEKKASLDAQAAIGTLYLATKQATQTTRRIAGGTEHPKLSVATGIETTN